MKFLISSLLVLSSSVFASGYSCSGSGVSVEIVDIDDSSAEITLVENGKRSFAETAVKDVAFQIVYKGKTSGDAQSVTVTIDDFDEDKVLITKANSDKEKIVDCQAN